MPSLMAARWVGHDSGPIFRHLWTKLHKIKFARAVVSEVCNTSFPIDNVLFLSGDVRDQVAKLSEITPKFRCFWAAKFWGHPNF